MPAFRPNRSLPIVRSPVPRLHPNSAIPVLHSPMLQSDVEGNISLHETPSSSNSISIVGCEGVYQSAKQTVLPCEPVTHTTPVLAAQPQSVEVGEKVSSSAVATVDSVPPRQTGTSPSTSECSSQLPSASATSTLSAQPDTQSAHSVHSTQLAEPDLPGCQPKRRKGSLHGIKRAFSNLFGKRRSTRRNGNCFGVETLFLDNFSLNVDDEVVQQAPECPTPQSILPASSVTPPLGDTCEREKPVVEEAASYTSTPTESTHVATLAQSIQQSVHVSPSIPQPEHPQLHADSIVDTPPYPRQSIPPGMKGYGKVVMQMDLPNTNTL